MKKILFTLSIVSLLISCGGDKEPSAVEKGMQERKKSDSLEAEIGAKARQFFAALPENAFDEEHPYNEAQVKLGKFLYFDNRLSKDGNISCNSCHNLATFGVDNKPVSEGDDGSLGERNSPTVYNAALHLTQFWDGRAKDVEEQAGMPILNPVEMHIPNEGFLVDRLKKIELYQELFAASYPDQKDPITYANLQLAIGAYERTLITPSQFDKYIAGKQYALGVEEKEGLKAFLDNGCTTCHTGALLGGNLFQKFGLYGNYWEETGSKKIDEGRFTLTQNEIDKYMFKVPTLRNIEKTGPYFHDGSVTDLKKAVQIMGKINSGKDINDADAEKIVTFLKSLTGSTDGLDIKEPEELKGAPVQ